MYIAILLVLLAIAGFLVVMGLRRKRPALFRGGFALALATGFFFWLMGFWGELLWFDALGHEHRFWKTELAQYALVLLGLGFGTLVVWLCLLPLPRNRRGIRHMAMAAGAVAGMLWGAGIWDEALIFIYGQHAGYADPVLGIDSGFFLFRLPFLDELHGMLFSLALFSLLAALAGRMFGFTMVASWKQVLWGEADKLIEVHGPDDFKESGASALQAPGRALERSLGAMFLVLAMGAWLARYYLLYSTAGAAAGPGWTDVNVRLPVYSVMAALLALCGLILLLPPLADRAGRILRGQGAQAGWRAAHPGVAMALVCGVLWFTGLTVAPAMFQWLVVEPNEITMERPYIVNAIEFTRKGYGLDDVEVREFPAAPDFTRDMVENNRSTFENIRLWDWRALDAVYKQFQEIRLYYEFPDVDIDRYTIDGAYREVMVSAREMEQRNLPAQSQTFVNSRFKYTHGYGLTLTGVSEFTPQGLPNLLIKDIPPVSSSPDLEVTRPEIYYGELTREYVVVNSKEKEFDYPSGENNVFVRYQGTGGVQLSSFWRNFVYGWKFDGTQFFVSGYPTPQSRIMFHRQVEERVRNLAPFLRFDDDPYIVLVDGKLHWIVDAYTTSQYFPYSEAYEFYGPETLPQGGDIWRQTDAQRRRVRGQVNYVRNSVKAVVDAYDGEVTLYVFDEQDPLLGTWRAVFPELFTSREDMPDALERHVRYPSDLLSLQGTVYAKYHMDDPAVFYNQEDLWVKATEKYYDQVQTMEPYYVMWERPGMDAAQMALIQPFTPKNRQVLIGWIAGLCDPPDYGRFLAYKFPKERRVLGPQQVETKIDQDRFLAGQLTLWDQRGSQVIRGNVLAIPVDDTLIYVEPIYLQADTAAYPELRLVVIMHNDILSYGESFDEALEGLFEGGKTAGALPQKPAAGLDLEELAQRAGKAYEDYLSSMGQKSFEQASRALENLGQTLEKLLDRAQQARDAVTPSAPQPPAEGEEEAAQDEST